MAYNQPYYGYYPQYNNGASPDMLTQFKGQYQPQMQMPQPMAQQPIQQMPQPKPTNDMIWVQGEAGAKAYLVAPNNTVTLWDSESQTIYIKSADMNGVPSMQILDFSYRNNTPKTPEKHECQCGDKFVSKDAFEALEAKFEALEAKFNSITAVTNNMEDN